MVFPVSIDFTCKLGASLSGEGRLPCENFDIPIVKNMNFSPTRGVQTKTILFLELHSKKQQKSLSFRFSGIF